MNNRLFDIRLILAAVILASSATASAQVSIGPAGVFRAGEHAAPPRSNREVYQITVTPASEPSPPLKYALYPRSYELQPGDSVPYWYRAMFDFGRKDAQGEFKIFNDNMRKWLDGPISEMPIEDVRTFLSRREGSLQDARVAAMRSETNWDLRLYDLRGTDTIYFLLPEFQESRTLARFVALQMRLAIADGNYDGAMEWARVNFRLARDVAQPETLINQLIGTAIVSITCDNLVDLIAAPNSPSLYWALASIPQPPINYRTSFEFEQTLPERFVTWLSETDPPRRTPEEWRTLFRQTVRDVTHELELEGIPIDANSPDWQVDLATTALTARNFARCKRDLVSWGHSPESLDRMPVGRVVALHSRAMYEQVVQDTAKWTLLPHPKVADQIAQGVDRLSSDGWVETGWESRETFPIVNTLMPAFSQAYEAEARGTIRPVALMVVEAIRMHAWENEGRLPATLQEITVVPVPDNPATGQPFPYGLEGNVATLDVATSLDPEDASWYWRVEMRVDPKWISSNK